MKTSNKILLGFFTLIFLTPVFVLMTFKSIVKNGHFTVVKNNPYIGDNQRSGFLKPYKVMRIAAPEGTLFKCDLQFSDSAFYSYSNSGDSIKIYYQADTVFVEYAGISYDKNNPDQFHNEIYADLKIPSLSNIIVENAQTTIGGEYGLIPEFHAIVLGSGLLKIGADEDGEDTRKTESPVRFGRLSLQSNNGAIILGKSVHAEQLSLDINGNTSITIEEERLKIV